MRLLSCTLFERFSFTRYITYNALLLRYASFLPRLGDSVRGGVEAGEGPKRPANLSVNLSGGGATSFIGTASGS